MGIRFACPNGHKLNVKDHLAGKRGICPSCGAKFTIPLPQQAQIITPASQVGRGSDDFGSQSVLIRVAEPGSSSPPFDEIPESAVIGIPERPVVAPSPVVPPVPLTIDPPPELETSEEPKGGPQSTAGPSLDELFMPPVGDAAVVPTAAEPAEPGSRRSGRQLQLLMAIVLLLTVIILAGVLIWVLRREPPVTTAQRGHAVRLAQVGPRPYIEQAEVV